MGAQLRLVRRRISSVQSIAKITRAQELIASSRIVRAQQQMRAAEPYARELTRAVEAVISRSATINHPFTEEPENPSRAAVLILTSDQGFAGAYNANVLRESARLRQLLRDRGIEPVLYVAGRRASPGTGSASLTLRNLERFLRRAEVPGRAAIHHADRGVQCRPGRRAEGGVDEIHGLHRVRLDADPATRGPRILPLQIEETEEQHPSGPLPQYEFEPSPADVLDALMPQYVASGSLRDAGGGGRRAGLAAARDEGGHRQRG